MVTVPSRNQTYRSPVTWWCHRRSVFPSPLKSRGPEPPVIVSVSVAELSVGSGSPKSEGAVTVAVFATWSLPETVASREKTTDVPASSDTSSSMSPEPDAVQLAPESARQVQVAPVSPEGSVSITRAFATSAGPAFATVIE